ncbi:hypothetical protein COA17_11075 [Sphingomonas ginsenosidimutans]|jgi:hypothetical protein|uniref:Uncharacterized protein n=1 Tax=Sphingomonas ginsenosidimutans TaxID=862134 RepID=A0A2A4HXD1_9SPHN|nr:hypothetical protein [Sphingomonas ginsenosidimutans]PCG08691.1 hypothetical protein COA17_11075 [Sphingomonas ginsenosidimutans]
MKYIHLLSPAYLNGGGYVDAGVDVPVGDDKLEITEERADGIVSGLRGKISEVADDDTDGADEGETPATPRTRGRAK